MASELLIVGSGLFGLTIARLAAEDGHRVQIIEKRAHPGGNSWSEIDAETGIEVHKYGSHLFHTSNKAVWQFSNRFTEFTSYQHHVFSRHKGKVLSLPVNLKTAEDLFGQPLTPSQFKQLLQIETQPFVGRKDESLEGRALALVGPTIYEALFKNYTQKQWGIEPSKLPAEVITRLPIRTTYNSRYFADTYEGLPVHGYFNFIQNLVDHANIQLNLNVDFFDHPDLVDGRLVVYTGPLDRFFEFRFGPLSWRTLDFELETLDLEDFQGCAVMNLADLDSPWTRIHEFKHLHPEREKTSKTVIAKEFSRICESESDEPYYPVNSTFDREKLVQYRQLASSQENVLFGGRLGSYQYLDMHMAIASAMSKYQNEIRGLLLAGSAKSR